MDPSPDEDESRHRERSTRSAAAPVLSEAVAATNASRGTHQVTGRVTRPAGIKQPSPVKSSGRS